MKKFFSFFYMIIAVIVLAFAYFTGFFNPKNLMSSVNAESEIVHTVNFYGSDNETVIYSVNVPEGQSLQDLQENNLLNNSYFETLPITNNTSSSNYFNNWYFTYVSSSLISNGVQMTNNNSWQGLSYRLPFNELTSNYFFSFSARLISGVSNFGIYTRFYDENGNVLNTGVGSNVSLGSEFQSFSLDIDVPENYSLLLINLWFNTNVQSTVQIEWTNLVEKPDFNSFFNIGYLNRLTGGSKNWSTSLEYYKKFDFNQPINSDLNLYFDVERNFSEKEIALDVISKSNVISNTSLNSVKNLHVQGDLKREVNITNLTSSNFLTASLSSSAITSIKTLNYFSIDIIDSSTSNSINLVFESDTPFSVISNSNTFSISADENTTFKLSIGVSGFPDTSQQIFQSIETFNFTSNLTNFEQFLNVFASNNYKFITEHNFAEIPFNYFQSFQNNQAEDLNLNGSLTLTLRYFENGSLTRQNYNVSSVHTKTTGISFEVPLISASGVRVLFESYEFLNGSTFILNTESNLILNNIDSVFYTLIDYESNLEYNLTFNNSDNLQDSNYLLFYNSDLNKKDYQLTTFLIDFNENFEFNVNNLTSNSFDLNIPFTINSVYYRPPLNTSKELDKFNFKVPEYLSTDIEFSLSPLKLYIPFSNYIYNFIIYLLFYAPLLSDIVYLIYLVIQTLMKCFNLVISFFVGVSSNFFIVILLGFIILNFVLKFTLGGRDG